MALLREDELEAFLKRRAASMNGLLIHGADLSAVSLLARRTIAALKGESVQVDIPASKNAPGGFMDQMLSLSLLGDRQVLVVDGADESCLKFLEPALAQTSVVNFALITSDALGKSSKLRAAVEASQLFAGLALYEEDEAAARERIRKLLAAQALVWAGGAEELFFETVGFERAVVTSEAEKLALYCLGQSEVSPDDVSAICGDVAGFDVDELIDAVLAGDMEATDRIFLALGTEQLRFLPLFTLHLSRLQAFRAEMEQGNTADGVLRNARPPIFFKRKNAFAAQLRRLSLEDLALIQESSQAAILQSRKLGDLSAAVLSRSLLAIARSCRGKSPA